MLSGFPLQAVSAHNWWRKVYHVGGLRWNATLAAHALEWGKQCRWEHDPRLQGWMEGQNMATEGSSDGSAVITGDSMVSSWVKGDPDRALYERTVYDPDNPQASHFTQVSIDTGASHEDRLTDPFCAGRMGFRNSNRMCLDQLPCVFRGHLFALLAGCKVGRLQLQHRQHRRTVRVSASTPPAGIADTVSTATMSQRRKVVSRDDANLAIKLREIVCDCE